MGNPLPKSHDHSITLADAAAQTRAHRQGGTAGSTDSGAFLAEPLKALLAQPGCVGLRYYKGRGKDGADSMVLVGVDEKGNDMTAGVLVDAILPCPPFCADANALNT